MDVTILKNGITKGNLLPAARFLRYYGEIS
jgi:hypothetical protein